MRKLSTLPLSNQSIILLQRLAQEGIYGQTPEEVAGRFVDQALQRLATPPILRIKRRRKSGKQKKP